MWRRRSRCSLLAAGGYPNGFEVVMRKGVSGIELGLLPDYTYYAGITKA